MAHDNPRRPHRHKLTRARIAWRRQAVRRALAASKRAEARLVRRYDRLVDLEQVA